METEQGQGWSRDGDRAGTGMEQRRGQSRDKGEAGRGTELGQRWRRSRDDRAAGGGWGKAQDSLRGVTATSGTPGVAGGGNVPAGSPLAQPPPRWRQLRAPRRQLPHREQHNPSSSRLPAPWQREGSGRSMSSLRHPMPRDGGSPCLAEL